MPRFLPRTAILLGAAASTAYFVLGRLGGGGWVALKVASIVALAAAAGSFRTPGALALGLAILVHSGGDLLIEVGPLPIAMAAFGVGHVLYARLFLRERRPWEEVGAGIKVRLGLLALVGAGLLAWLGPHLEPPFDVAVPIYAALLLAMAASAQLSGRGMPWVAIGAGLFVLSDSLLALDLFAGPLAWTRGWVWPSYWLAQAAIAVGWLWGPSRSGGLAGD